jgi:hypothetical protein
MGVRTFVVLGSLLVLPGMGLTLRAQEAPRLPAPVGHPRGGTDRESATSPNGEHRFWDRKNAGLFVGVAGARALDYASSRYFRGKQINERLLSNALIDNRPLFAAVEAAGVAGSIGAAYLFHRTGHHKIERWVSIIHISVGVGGSVRNYLLQPDAPPAVPQ